MRLTSVQVALPFFSLVGLTLQNYGKITNRYMVKHRVLMSWCIALLFLSGISGVAKAEFTNASGHDSQATLEATALTQPDNGKTQIAADIAAPNLSTSATELDAIRLEIVELRRFMVLLGGMFFAFKIMEYLFKWV